MANRGTGALMKTGVLVAAAILVVRIVLEQQGAPEAINNIFGVAWLYFIFPVLFALRIHKSGVPGRFRALLTDLLLFAVYTRLMVAVTYAAAFLFQWRPPRFGQAMGGTVGPGVSPLQGLLVIPLRNALFWVVFAAVIGMIIGAATLFLKRKSPAAGAA